MDILESLKNIYILGNKYFNEISDAALNDLFESFSNKPGKKKGKKGGKKAGKKGGKKGGKKAGNEDDSENTDTVKKVAKIADTGEAQHKRATQDQLSQYTENFKNQKSFKILLPKSINNKSVKILIPKII